MNEENTLSDEDSITDLTEYNMSFRPCTDSSDELLSAVNVRCRFKVMNSGLERGTFQYGRHGDFLVLRRDGTRFVESGDDFKLKYKWVL